MASASSAPSVSSVAAAGANNAQQPSASSTTTGAGSGTPTADAQADKHKRFENEGVVFKAKLIGSELVMEPRGDKMCQNSIQRLKAIIKGTNSHKKRVVLKISYEGVRVFDEKSNELLHHHEVSQISYIASDDTDNRTFGYVSDVPSKAHQFICFKTSGPAISVMSVISALFEAVLEKKNQAEKEKQLLATTSGIQQQDSIDLIGDSGIVDGDTSLAEAQQELSNHSIQQQQEVNKRHHQTHLQNHQQQKKQSSSSMLDGLVLGSPSDSFGAAPAAAAPGSSYQQQLQQVHQRGQQSTSAADMIFDDLFAGLSDPIIVDKNESLVSYKQQQQQQLHLGAGSSSNFGGSQSGSLAGLGAGAPGGASGAVDGNFQAPLQAPQQVPLRSTSQQHQHHQGWQIPRRSSGQHQFHQKQALLPPPSSLPRPVPMMMAHSGPSHNRSLVYNHSSVSLSDAALTRQSSFTSSANNNNNNTNQNNNTASDSFVDRYAVFNDIDNLPSIFESASLGSVNKINQQQQQHQHQPLQPSMMMMMNNNFTSNNNTSTSLGQQLSSSTSQAEGRMFRQRNPFDDDFFA